jgi:hypothetical protein
LASRFGEMIGWVKPSITDFAAVESGDIACLGGSRGWRAPLRGRFRLILGTLGGEYQAAWTGRCDLPNTRHRLLISLANCASEDKTPAKSPLLPVAAPGGRARPQDSGLLPLTSSFGETLAGMPASDPVPAPPNRFPHFSLFATSPTSRKGIVFLLFKRRMRTLSDEPFKGAARARIVREF